MITAVTLEDGKGLGVNVDAEAGWEAKLDLIFARSEKKTVLKKRTHKGPLQVQKPFYPEGETLCHVYLLHPPGGVVGGDRLNIDVTAEKDAHVLATTPAAGKFYRSNGKVARQQNRLCIAPGAAIEWFPQENIAFDGANVKTATCVELSPGSGFMGWEILCLGRPASNEKFNSGSFRQSFELWREGRPLWIERSAFKGRGPQMSRWGMAGNPVTASFVCVTGDAGLKEKVRKVMGNPGDGELVSVTQLGEVLVCRYLGHRVENAKRLFISAWEVLRPVVMGRVSCAPRIWNT